MPDEVVDPEEVERPDAWHLTQPGMVYVFGDRSPEIGDDVWIGRGVSFGAGVTVGDGATIGDGATVYPGVSIGDGATVEPGAEVGENVPAGGVAPNESSIQAMFDELDRLTAEVDRLQAEAAVSDSDADADIG